MTDDSSTNLEGERQPYRPEARSNWLRHPIVSIVVAAICVLLGWLGNWWFSSSVQPVYRVFPTEIVARRESPRLTVEWDGIRIENLCVAKIALWNAGSTPLSQNLLPSSDPLRIQPSKKIRILSVEQSNSSRPTLRVAPHMTFLGTDVELQIKDGDAMEKGDGVALRVLFTGDCSSDFVVNGRVIGASAGFKKQAEESTSVMLLVAMGIAGLIAVMMNFAQFVANWWVPLTGSWNSWAKHSIFFGVVTFALAFLGWKLFGRILGTPSGQSWLP